MRKVRRKCYSQEKVAPHRSHANCEGLCTSRHVWRAKGLNIRQTGRFSDSPIVAIFETEIEACAVTSTSILRLSCECALPKGAEARGGQCLRLLTQTISVSMDMRASADRATDVDLYEGHAQL